MSRQVVAGKHGWVSNCDGKFCGLSPNIGQAVAQEEISKVKAELQSVRESQARRIKYSKLYNSKLLLIVLCGL